MAEKGGSKFSKIMNKVWGPTGSGPRPPDGLNRRQKDALFRYQLAHEDPIPLTPLSLLVAQVCETKHYSGKVFQRLQKHEMLSKTGTVDTTKITKRFANQIAVISLAKMRDLVDLLFFWEEEAVRLRFLREEEGDIRDAMRALGHDDVDLKAALMVVETKFRMLPSLRDGSAATAEPELPAYSRTG
ncbi:MAG: hypothetical protein M1813_009644 [Trichoglossum hirsutum]|nr:MAG: hypothetical protein M1813_009644 [Trichoglossum hirsutum]